MNAFAVLLTVAGIARSTLATDYCSSTLCNTGVTHIACGSSGNFASTCAADAAMVNLDDSLTAIILKGHNQNRNFIAGGGDGKHDRACRMATMKWNNEMASLAALNVKQCAMVHDKCRNTNAFRYSGQNLAWVGYYGTPDYPSLLQQCIDMWYEEVEYSNMTYIKSYPSNYRGPAIGHFTVMMVDRNTDMGCAVATYSETGVKYKKFLLACNYAATNMINKPIYASCSNAARNCTTGTNPSYLNLCSPSEVYDVNKW